MNNALSLEEIQQCELEILKKAILLFNKHGIRYLLAYGTMLGAVRHNGFIPWDDDIDIFVPREDYEKLKRILRGDGEESSDKLSYGIPGDKGYPYPFIKITDLRYRVDDIQIKNKFQLNLWIDIFPLDNIPDINNQDRKIIRETAKYMNLLGLEIAKESNHGSLKYCIKRLICKLMGGYRGIARFIDYRAQRINKLNFNSKVMGNIVWPQYGRDFFDIGIIFPLKLQEFCDLQLYIPENYAGHLSYLYGDYMQLPPKDKRQRHYFQVYDMLSERLTE